MPNSPLGPGPERSRPAKRPYHGPALRSYHAPALSQLGELADVTQSSYSSGNVADANYSGGGAYYAS